eukprot:CAMPEP_0113676142 /NCGR_PEP_ID=MMETSP0038_2-20120614/8467_1 /TAXON_ID=2898 /ORGANISM="Cryptomonas paramecium" /LENGTH=68 /DNA_ID=CAMNT_0000593115 /DNA_START=46 /DNA_END=252 /DNA_ORIENTATION=+ /assembly_acc=CAM_ASM_000170
MALSHALAKLGPVPVQVGLVVSATLGASYGILNYFRVSKPEVTKTQSKEWRDAATIPNPLRDPQGKLR